jgi:hypothetical protein
MSYLYLRVITNEDGDVEEELAAKIEKICPDIDLSSGFDYDKDWDENENPIYSYAFGYGNDNYCDDDMNSLEGRAWDIADMYQWCELLAYYIDFTRIEGENDFSVSIADGSQGGYSSKLRYAIRDLFSCEKTLDNLKTDIESDKFWDLGRRQVRVINGKTFYSDNVQIYTDY